VNGRPRGGDAGWPKPARLSLWDQLAIGSFGIRTRKARAALSALGIGVGIAALVAVTGLAGASKADLMAQLTALGTNLLVAGPGQTAFGDEAALPATAPGMVGAIAGVERSAATYHVDAKVYRSDRVPATKTAGLSVLGADPGLLDTVRGTVARGRWLDAAGAYPVAVLGATAGERLALTSWDAPVVVWIAGRPFAIVGLLGPSALAPELDTAVLIGTPMAGRLGAEAADTPPDQFDLAPTRLYLRVAEGRVAATRDLVPRTANPAAPGEVDVSRPSDALAAQAAADASLTALGLALGGIGLAVGGIGITNVMVVAVLERIGEIGLRRAVGATRRAIRQQFTIEAILLAALGGCGGAVLGVAATLGVAGWQGWPPVVPWSAIGLGLVSSLVIGALAGTWPAVRAGRIQPITALRAAP
jgi:putative ABC transport system permease protein